MKQFTTERFMTIAKKRTILGREDRSISSFQEDYMSIVSSSSFRRMQDKTQVYPLSRGDFVRTRLTHTLEVSVIAEQIAIYALEYLREDKRKINKAFNAWTKDDEASFVEVCKTVALIHDIGNPPFGHFGEELIKKWFVQNRHRVLFRDQNNEKITLKNFINSSKTYDSLYSDFENFDGNVQGFRVITKTQQSASNYGFNLTKSLIRSMVKYPVASKEIDNTDFKKIGYYVAEKNLFDDVSEATGLAHDKRHISTYILEAADDIAYRTADIEDAVAKGLITMFNIKSDLEKYLDLSKHEETGLSNNRNDDFVYREFMEVYERYNNHEISDISAVASWIEVVRINFMKVIAAQLYFDFNILSDMKHQPSHYELVIESYCKNFFIFGERIAEKRIYDNNENIKTEIGAKATLFRLMDAFIDAIVFYDFDNKLYTEEEDIQMYYHDKVRKLFLSQYDQVYANDCENAGDNIDEPYKMYLRILRVIDFVSGLTDGNAVELSQELNGLV